jgi:DNA-binding response OmpR family regulator
LIQSHDQKHPIFFCFGVVTEGDKKAAFDAGSQGYFGRPFDPDEMTVTLRAAVKIQPTWTTFLRSVFTSLMPRSHPYTFRAPIVSDQPFRVFYPDLASAMMFTVGHFVLPFFIATVCSNE